MDKQSKIFFIVFGILLATSVLVTYLKIMVFRDFMIEAEADCDPSTEKCFVWECDPEYLEEGEECSGDPAEDISYYKILRRNAKRIPLCDPAEEDCQALSCGVNEPECEFVYCTEENKDYYEVECSDPETYLELSQEEELLESLDCLEGDICDSIPPLEPEALVSEEGEVLPENIDSSIENTAEIEAELPLETVTNDIASSTSEPLPDSTGILE